MSLYRKRGARAYRRWIARWLATHPTPYGRCAEATLEMVAVFPELTRVPGYVMDGAWGKREHWWLTTSRGRVVDPTVSQFPCPLTYLPHQDGDPVRLGRCMHCGDHIWGLPDTGVDTAICSATCRQRLHDEYNKDIR